LRSGDVEAARAAFRRAHQLAPDEAEPALALGRIEWRLGWQAEAERLLELAHFARPAWPLAAAALARLYLASPRAARRRAALRVLRAARRSHPDHPAILVVLAEDALVRGRIGAARRGFAAARSAGADEDVVRAGLSRVENAIGLSLAGRRRRTEAAFAFKRAADLDPTWSSPQVNLGVLLERMARAAAARAHYARALELEPNNTTAHFHLGRLAQASGDVVAAEGAFERASRGPAPHPRARHELALLLAERGRLDEAADLLERELLARPRAKTVRANLRQVLERVARAHMAAGRLIEAAEVYRRARSLGHVP
jgi:Flp pilus assembly protein TadD